LLNQGSCTANADEQLLCSNQRKCWHPDALLLAAACVVFLQAYVQFVDTAGAQKARDAIHGRMFAGNPVSAVYLTAQAYGVAMAAMEEDKQQQQ
jgi:hypothetical protein